MRSGRIDNLSTPLDSTVAPGVVEEEIAKIRSTSPSTLQPLVADDAIDGLKFSDCLPRDLARDMLATRLSDPQGCDTTLREPVRFVRT